MWKNPPAAGITRLFGRILGTALILSIVSALIESIAGVAGRTRLIDLTSVFIEYPFWIVVFGGWAAWIVRRLQGVSWLSAIERTLPFAPLALLIPSVNCVVSWLGLESVVPAFVNVLEAPVSILTFGWWPRFLASPGVLMLLIAVAGLFVYHSWKEKHAPKRILGAVLLWIAGTLGGLLLPSLVSWATVSAEISPLNAGPNVLARTWVALSQEGYWWRSMLERFPGVLEGEAEASVRFLRISGAWLIALAFSVFAFFRQVSFSPRHLLSWFKPVRGVSFLGAAFFGLWIGGLFGGRFFVRVVDGIPFLLFLVTALAVWGVSVWRNDIHDLEQDLAAGRSDRPLVKGDVRPADFAWMGKAMLCVAGISGWLLGWPVFLPLMGFLVLQEGLSAAGLRWKERMVGGPLLALSFVCVATSGIFFALRTAAVPLLPATIWLMLAAFYLFQAIPKAIRWSPRLLQVFTTSLRIPPRMLIPIALALGYLLVPLLSGWTVLWWLALPCAVVALLPLLGSGRWDERKIVGWQTAFLIIAFLLLSVRPSS